MAELRPQLKIAQLPEGMRDEWLQHIGALRVEAWRSKYGELVNIPGRVWLDEHDAHATHWVAISPDSSIIGAARCCIHERPDELPDSDIVAPLVRKGRRFLSLNRLVVSDQFRGRGIASRLDDARLEFAGHQTIDAIVVIARGRRVRALMERGFELLGGFDVEEGHPLQRVQQTHAGEVLFRRAT